MYAYRHIYLAIYPKSQLTRSESQLCLLTE